MQWNTQAIYIMTNLEVKIDFTFFALNRTNVVTWNYNVDDSTKGRHNMILGKYILTELGLNKKIL